MGNTGESTLAQRLQLARTSAGQGADGRMTQEAFAEAVGKQLGKRTVGKVTISRWERGDTVPTLESLLAIARASRVDPGWLAFGNNSRAPAPGSRSILDEVLRQVSDNEEPVARSILEALFTGRAAPPKK
jgi:transcriptional regulator with XRE-family HTH domain